MWKGHNIYAGMSRYQKKPKKKKPQKKLKRGRITKKEMVQVRFARPISKEVHPRAPVEAVRGIGPKKGKKLRKQGISTVAELRRHQQKSRH